MSFVCYRARLQELMLERGETPVGELGDHADRERLATANAQRNIVSAFCEGVRSAQLPSAVPSTMHDVSSALCRAAPARQMPSG